jgi:hypothetical protein
MIRGAPHSQPRHLPGHSNGTSLVSLELRPRSVTTDSRLVTQADRSDAGRDVETGAALWERCANPR